MATRSRGSVVFRATTGSYWAPPDVYKRQTRAAGLGEIHLAAIEFGVQDWCAGAFDCDVATVLALSLIHI